MNKTSSSLSAELRHSYFALATFNLLIVITILFSHQHYMRKFSSLVDANQKKLKLIGDLSALSELIVLASAPGNDIFENGDIEEAERRFHVHRSQIKMSMESAKSQIHADYLRREELLAQLDQLESELDSAEASTLKLFSKFRSDKRNPPGAEMAVADRAFARAFRSLTTLKLAITESQQASITDHQNALLSNQQKEIMFSIFGLVALGGLIAYGRTLTRHLSRQAQLETEYLENNNRMISDLREANTQLQTREAYIQSLFNQSRDPIMTLAPPIWKFTTANPAALQLFGAGTQSEFLNLGPWSVSPEKQPDGRLSAELANHAIETAMKDGSHFFEWMHCKLDGTPIPCTVLLSKVAVGDSVFLQATVRDITEQKMAEQNLRQKTQQMDSFFLISIDMLCIAGKDAKFIRVNPAFSETLGFSQDELISRPYLDFIHPDDLQKTLIEVERLSNGEPTAHFENRYRCKDGSYKLISWKASPDPETELIYAAARDVTLERAKQTELSEVMRAIEHSAIVAVTDTSGQIISVNRAFCDMTGFDAAELVGQNHDVISSTMEPVSKIEDLAAAKANGMTWSGEFKNRKKNGQIYTVKSVIAPVHDIKGKIDRFICISFDLSEQKHLQYQLEEAQAVARIGNWRFDLQTNRIEWSKQMYELFPENIEKGPPEYDRHGSTIHPEDRPAWEEIVTKCARDGKPYRMRFRSVFPDRTLWIEALGQGIFDTNGRVISLSGTCQDISEKVVAEQKLEEERLKTLHAAKLASLGEMAAGVAHEINNPLAIIAGTTGILRKLKNDPEKLLSKIETIDKSVARITKIVRGLSKFSRSSDSVEMAKHNLADLLNDALVITEAKAKRHSVVLERSFTTEGAITCDGMEIEQVIINLVNNAVDACKDLPEKWVKIVLTQKEFEVVLQIHDSGPGVSPEIEDKLFQPFFTTKPIGEGTGLGLSICKGILDHHQAQLSLNRSFPNTCFEIRFRAIS